MTGRERPSITRSSERKEGRPDMRRRRRIGPHESFVDARLGDKLAYPRPQRADSRRLLVHRISLIVLLLASSFPALVASTNDLDFDDSNCTPVEGSCTECSQSDKLEIPECMDTGKRQDLLCPSSEGGSEIRYGSCTRTVADEEFRVVRLQALWLVVGGMAMIAVRRLKRQYASLFDQRRLGSNRSERPVSNIELTESTAASNTNMEEMRPLTASAMSSESMEVV